MEPLAAALAIAVVFAILVWWIAHNDSLVFLGPKSTRSIKTAAQDYCVNQCREAGVCPLTQSSQRAANCPLFAFISADVPVVTHGSPFE